MALLRSEKGTQMKGHKAEKVFHIARLRHSLLLRFTTSSLSVVENTSSQSFVEKRSRRLSGAFFAFSFSGSNH